MIRAGVRRRSATPPRNTCVVDVGGRARRGPVEPRAAAGSARCERYAAAGRLARLRRDEVAPGGCSGEREHGAREGDDRRDEQDVVEPVDEERRGRPRAPRAPGTRRAALGQDLGGTRASAPARVAGQDVLEERAERGDAGRDADLAEGRVDARAHARALRRDDADRRRGQRRVDERRCRRRRP